jgi:tRNA (cytidine/uridine-2'-O-)-methyltransferase
MGQPPLSWSKSKKRHPAGRLLAPLPPVRKPAIAASTKSRTKRSQSGFLPAQGCCKRAAGLMRIALYQPDIPQNAGTILRLAACLGVEAHIIEPAGFPVSDRHFRRSGMDYLDRVTIVRHSSWTAFKDWRRGAGHRLLLFTTAAAVSYLDYSYQPDDILLFGRESAGVPDEVHTAADARLTIRMQPGLRSMNVAVAAAMALGEALRQTRR